MIKAVIDADFFVKLTTNELSSNLFLRIMDELEMFPVMHQYVYTQELKYNRFIKELVQKNRIEVYNYKDYLITEQDKDEYKKYFFDSYEYLLGVDFPEEEDIYTYHVEKEHLGEIRSVYLAIKMGIPYFASDDKGARSFAKNYVLASRRNLTVISLVEAIRMCKENGSALCWKDFKSCLPTVYKKDSKKIDLIKQILEENYARY